MKKLTIEINDIIISCIVPFSFLIALCIASSAIPNRIPDVMFEWIGLRLIIASGIFFILGVINNLLIGKIVNNSENVQLRKLRRWYRVVNCYAMLFTMYFMFKADYFLPFSIECIPIILTIPAIFLFIAPDRVERAIDKMKK